MSMDSLKDWGYREQEGAFLSAVEACGGWFVGGQYNRFRGAKSGDTVRRLIVKGMHRGHIRERKLNGNRVLYRWLGAPPERASRVAESSIIRSLIALDFVISNQNRFQFVLCPEQKLEQLCGAGERIPSEPLFLKGTTLGLCYVDSHRCFRTWLERYSELFKRISQVLVVYCSASKRRVTVAKMRVLELSARAQSYAEFRYLGTLFNQPETRRGMTEDQVVRYRELRKLHGVFGATEDRIPPHMEITVERWWEPGVTTYFSLFTSLPKAPAPAQPNSLEA